MTQRHHASLFYKLMHFEVIIHTFDLCESIFEKIFQAKL